MDQPLFGEQRKEQQVFQYIVMFLVGGFTAFSLIAGVVQAIKTQEPTLFAMVATLFVTFIDLAILYWWYRDKEDRLHPKFKWLLVALIVTVLLTAATTNAFAWKKQLVCPAKPTCPGGLMNTDANDYCYTVFNFPSCISYPDSFCMKFQGAYGSCFNMTAPPTNYEFYILAPQIKPVARIF